jgi:hypothetical protein
MKAMNKKTITIGAACLGVCFIVLALYYWLVPAGSLLTFMPGYEAGSATVHFKHGLAALVLGALCFIYAWFQSGPKKLR